MRLKASLSLHLELSFYLLLLIIAESYLLNASEKNYNLKLFNFILAIPLQISFL